MSIPSQLPPQLALAIRQGALQALALQAGQVIEAKVLGTAPNGLTQVQIGQQTLNLSLPILIAAGTTLNFQAQGSGAQQKLLLVPTPTLTPAPSTAAPAQAGEVLALVVATPPGAIATTPLPAPAVSLPTRPGALQPLVLQPGQRVDAQVLGPAPNGATQVQIGRQTLEVRLPTPLPAGSVLPLQVEGAGAQQRLLVALPATQAQVTPPALTTAPTPPVPLDAAPLAQSKLVAPAPTAAAPIAQPSGGPVPAGPPVSQSAPAPIASPPTPPQAALTQMVQAAVQRQDSIASLTTVLAAVVAKVALPQPVAQASLQVLAASLPLGPSLDGAVLQKAIMTSGVFQEAVLAQGAPGLAQGDLKTTLLTLRNTLVTWLGQAATTSAAGVAVPPLPPPVRGALPRARPTGMGKIDLPETPIEVGKVVLERAEGALARLRLHQHASLPESLAAGAPADWSMDIPVVIGTYQSVMQLQIHRDEAGPEQAFAERGWQIRFAMDLPKLGEVGAQVGLRGATTSVRLWATAPATARSFEEALPELARSLTAAGLRPGMVVVRADDPVANPPAKGHFVDALT